MRQLLLLSPLVVSLNQVLDLLVHPLTLTFEFEACFLQVRDVAAHLALSLLSGQRFAHAVSHGADVQFGEGVLGELDFVPSAHQQEASFRALDRDLADELIEALRVNFLALRTYARLFQLVCDPSAFELFLQIVHVGFRARGGRDVAHPQLSVLCVLLWGQDRV